MQNLRFVGLDVHKDTITMAVAESDKSPPQIVATVPNEVGAVARQLRRLGAAAQLRCCYEAGPTGALLCRALRARGFQCMLVAPSMIPQRAGDKVKTDRRDAVRLAKFLRSGDLVDVYVLDAQTEALRDVVRARDQAKRAERIAKVQLRSFLLRQGRTWSRGAAWSRDHLEWIRSQQFEHEAHNRVLVALVLGLEQAIERVKQLTADLEELAMSGPQASLIRSLQAMRGIKLLIAATLATEIGNFARFASPRSLAAYLGLVPSESSSGLTQRRGAITRAGNSYGRRVLVEAAWAYRHKPGITKKLKERQQNVTDVARQIAWKAQLRLTARFRRLSARGKNKAQVVTAIARELVGFVWAIASRTQAQPQQAA